MSTPAVSFPFQVPTSWLLPLPRPNLLLKSVHPPHQQQLSINRANAASATQTSRLRCYGERPGAGVGGVEVSPGPGGDGGSMLPAMRGIYSAISWMSGTGNDLALLAIVSGTVKTTSPNLQTPLSPSLQYWYLS